MKGSEVKHRKAEFSWHTEGFSSVAVVSMFYFILEEEFGVSVFWDLVAEGTFITQ
jgi:hypothetical protein